MKSIILGMFRTVYFPIVEIRTDSDRYPFFTVMNDEDWWFGKGSIIERVGNACEKADVINFVVDDLIPDYTRGSHTLLEIELIIDNPEYLAKTIFWRNEEELNGGELKDYLSLFKQKEKVWTPTW